MNLRRVLSGLAGVPLVVLLLALHWTLAWTATLEKSTTMDEVAHVTGGWSYWLRNDYRLHPENGILPQRVATLPFFLTRPAFPAEDAAWERSNVWGVGDAFFHRSGNDPDELLLQCRAVAALWGVALALLVYLWSRALFGRGGALVSLVLCVFCPNLLANGPLVTSDVAASFFFLAAAGSWWRLVHVVSPARFLPCALALAGLFLTKFSAVLFVPIGLVLLAIRLVDGRALEVRLARVRHVTGRGRQLALLLAVAASQVLLVAGAVWLAFGLRYSAFAHFVEGRDRLSSTGWAALLEDSGLVGRVIAALRAGELLPEAYLYGFTITRKYAENRLAFFNGEVGESGWFWFFPYAFLVKTPLSLLIVLGCAATAVFRRRTRDERGSEPSTDLGAALYRTAPLLTLLLVYGGFALTSGLNIGLRHILPVYPVLFVLAGRAGAWFERAPAADERESSPLPRLRLAPAIVTLALVALVVESLLAFPHYLAYFNPLAGGPRHGYRHLVDSSLDWGQDLPGLARWLEKNAESGTPVHLAYFGTGSPEHYGIHARTLPGYFDMRTEVDARPWRPGIYCISATMLQGVYNPLHGPWTQRHEELYRTDLQNIRAFAATENDPAARERLRAQANWPQIFLQYDLLRFERLCEHLRQREPDDHVGHSILIYRVSEEDLRRALD